MREPYPVQNERTALQATARQISGWRSSTKILLLFRDEKRDSNIRHTLRQAPERKFARCARTIPYK